MRDRTAFDNTRRIEQQAEELLTPLFDAVDPEWSKVTPLAEQFLGRDYLLRGIHTELKAEQEERWHNFFLERWSDRITQRRGWLYTCTSPVLIYVFMDIKVAHAIDFQALQHWALDPQPNDDDWPNVYAFKCPDQKKYAQTNVTSGWCVPISVIQQALGDKMLTIPISPDSAPALNQWLERTILALVPA